MYVRQIVRQTTWDGITMTETTELDMDMDMDLNGILLFSEQDSMLLNKIERLESKLERLERIMTKMGKVVVKHVADPKE
jgi:hypothetical protein